MPVSDDFLFADFLMDQKFRITTQILEMFVSSPSQNLSTTLIAEQTGRTTREVTQICKKLQLTGLVQPASNSSKAWKLAGDPGSITLEDVYRGMIAKPHHAPEEETNPDVERSRSVDLLIMQATMEVNQSIFKHLRQFSLGRPKNSHFVSARR
jgi:DNA-binding IscR family transcriptional regulator